MENKIIIYRKGLYKEVPLLGAFASDFHMGTDAHAQLRFVQEKFEVDFSIRLSVEEAAWKIACSEKICFQDGTGRTFAADTIRPGDDLKVINARSGQELFSLYFGFYFEETADQYLSDRRVRHQHHPYSGPCGEGHGGDPFAERGRIRSRA